MVFAMEGEREDEQDFLTGLGAFRSAWLVEEAERAGGLIV
jgi:hypothetical protein